MIRYCVHDRLRAGCDACDRIDDAHRSAAMVVLGLDAEDVELAHQAHGLRVLMRENGIDPKGARFLLVDADAQRCIEVVARMRRTAATDRGALDHRTVVDRYQSQHRLVSGLAMSHRQRAQTPDGGSRAHHEECAATWAAEAAVTRDVLELLGHTPSVADDAKGDQA